MGSAGKVLTIFIVIIAVLLISLTAISFFFFKKEYENRKSIEMVLNETKDQIKTFQNEIEKMNKKNFFLEEKNKEADERINSLLDELDLEEGLREEMKNENLSLKEKLGKEAKNNVKFKEQLAAALSDSENKMIELNEKIKMLESKNKELQNNFNNLGLDGLSKSSVAIEKSEILIEDILVAGIGTAPLESSDIKLDEIVVVPKDVPDGRILSVDEQTEFVIINLGEKDNVQKGDIMSVFRGQDYLGDIQVSRVQLEMSAADFIPPLSSRVVRKNDQVVSQQ